ncbi:hypothetical protein RFM68_27905 [Mesorhizobium sp. MSK_1335]|uniref:Uncharacterized protein n=1 Tax=Mesorhizobium montanum TaxID=3072323 RepID=A0ABU4ZTG0_9HYPH|nr:hypothetical protein [Mesorhizobium sp. MSK_1335]MDX8528307.1 hypothetical protein [Mesorhizobium sp. MSK_1335]
MSAAVRSAALRLSETGGEQILVTLARRFEAASSSAVRSTFDHEGFYGRLGIASLAEQRRKIIPVGAEIPIVAFEIEGLHMIVTSAAMGTCDAGSGHQAVMRELQGMKVVGIDPNRKHRQREEILRGIRQMHGVIEFAGRHADVIQHARAFPQSKRPELSSRGLAPSTILENGDCKPACFKSVVD